MVSAARKLVPGPPGPATVARIVNRGGGLMKRVCPWAGVFLCVIAPAGGKERPVISLAAFAKRPVVARVVAPPVARSAVSRPFRLEFSSSPMPLEYAVEDPSLLPWPATGALTSADFDQDGIADLVVGRGSSEGGQISLHLGNYEALWPYSAEAQEARSRGESIPPFLPGARLLGVAESADFAAAGDFDDDGHADVIVASRGGRSLYFLRGDGKGKLSPALTRRLPGTLSRLIQGEINRADGITDLVAAVDTPAGSQVLVFEGLHGVWNSSPESFELSSPVADLALGTFDAEPGIDLAVAAGNEILLIQGRDRRLSSRSLEAPAASLSRFPLSYSPVALAAGDFAGTRPEQLAALDDLGTVHWLSLSSESAQEGEVRQFIESGSFDASQINSLSRQDRLRPRLWSVKLAGSKDELLESSGSEARIWQWAPAGSQTAQAGTPRVVTLSETAELAGALPMRLGRDGLIDLVAVREGSPDPDILLQGGGQTFTVTNTDDSGPGSLRQAITDANLSAGADSIEFTIPGPGPYTISLLSPLPTVDDSVTIDGYTQAGSNPNSNPSPLGLNTAPLIELDGSQLEDAALIFTNGNNVLRGLVVNRFSTESGCLQFFAGNNFVEGNFVGTGLSGHSALPNGRGLTFVNSSNNVIGGTSPAARNLVSGNNDEAVIGFGGMGNRVEGNLIGTDIDGEQALGNALGVGFFIDSQSNVVGGTLAGSGNVVSGNRTRGVFFDGGEGHLIQGNRIGTNGSATTAIPNQSGGVLLNQPSRITVGGTAAEAGNVISSNPQIGITIYSGAGENIVQGNLIGTNGSGSAALGQTNTGVEAFDSPGNLIGGSDAGAANTISGNVYGVVITRTASTNNLVQGNRIGTALDSLTPVPNLQEGIAILNGATRNLIGGDSPGEGNLISFNGFSGVTLLRFPGFSDPGNGNSILGNSIFSNELLGIDLWGDDDVTLNDAGDTDEGPNQLQNFPRLDALTHDGGMSHLSGALESTPLTQYRLEFFSNTECDPTGFGEGRTLLGWQMLTTDASGSVDFQVDFPGRVDFVTSTATDPDGNTSEFSRCASEGEPPADLSLEVLDPPDGVIAGGSVSYTFKVGNNGPAAAEGVFVDSIVPEGLTATSTIGCLEELGAPTCSLGDLAPGSSTQFELTFEVSVFAEGMVELAASVGAPTAEAAPGDESLSIPLAIQAVPKADLELQTVALPNPVFSGLDLALTLTVSNNGPDPASGVTVTDLLPDGFEFLEGAGCSDLIGTVTCQLDDLASGAMGQLQLTIAVDSKASGVLTNQATVSADLPDPAPENNQAELPVTVILRGDLDGNSMLDGSDVASFLQELNDGDGNLVDDVAGGNFAGNADFDVNGDSLIDQNDLLLLASLLLDQPLDAPESGEQVILGTEAPAGSVLDFPRLTFAPGKITGVAIVNPDPQPADVVFTAYDQNGKRLAETERVIPPGKQLAELTFQIFGNLDPGTVGWFRASSDTPGLTGFFLDLDGTLKELDGADLPNQARRIVFNKIRIDSGFSTELSVVNTGNQTSTIDLNLVGGPNPIRKTIKLPPLGLARLDAATFFFDEEAAGLGQLPGASYVLAEAGQALAGFELVSSQAGDFEGLNARSALDFLNTIYIPQMATLGPFVSTVGVVNYSQQPVIVTLTAHQPDGQLFIPQHGQNPVSRSLDPGESLLEDVSQLFGFEGDSALEGWMEIASTNQAVNGYFSYRLPQTGASAAVAAISQPQRNSLFSHLATVPGFFTGVALLNPGALPANYRILAASPEGEVLGTFEGLLRPHERISRLIAELIGAAAGQNGGFVFVRSNLPLFSTALFGTSDVRVLANVPPQSVPSTFAPDASVAPARVTPPISVLQPGSQTQFQAQNLSGTLQWRVNGELGGNFVLGTIDEHGKYTAPESQPAELPVTVTAEAPLSAAGASVDVLAPETVLENLGVVQSLSFLESLGKLFSAELVTLAGASNSLAPRPFPKAALAPAGGTSSQIYALDSQERTLLAEFPGEDLRKLFPYRAANGKEYLLASAAVGQEIFRIDPENGDSQVVAKNLDVPDTMTLDPASGDLFVATASQIVRIAREDLDAGLGPGPAAAAGRPNTARHRFGVVSNLAGVTGIAVDNCTGNLLLAQGAQNRIFSLSPEGDPKEILPRQDEFGAPLDQLAAPNELLVTYREGVACPDATNLLFIEEGADRVSLYVPSEDLLISPWVEAPAPSDLILAPASDLDPDASVFIEQGMAPGGGGPSEVVAVNVSQIFEPGAENPPVSLPASSSTSPPGPDLTVSIASARAGDDVDVNVFYRPGASPAALLVLTIDYDEDVLQLANGTLAASATANLPGDFQAIGFHDPGESGRELGFLFVDPTPPVSTLEQGNILRIKFTVAPQARGVGDIWITNPGPQLIDVSGAVIPLNEVASGGVTIRP